MNFFYLILCLDFVSLPIFSCKTSKTMLKKTCLFFLEFGLPPTFLEKVQPEAEKFLQNSYKCLYLGQCRNIQRRITQDKHYFKITLRLPRAFLNQSRRLVGRHETGTYLIPPYSGSPFLNQSSLFADLSLPCCM